MKGKTGQILLITNIFPPDIGGPATFIPKLGLYLANRGYKVAVICTSDLAGYPGDSAFPFRLIRIDRKKNLLFRELQTRARIYREILRSSVVFANGLEHYVDWASTMARRPFVLKVVGDTVWETARNNGDTVMDIDEYQSYSQRSDILGPVSKRRYNYIRNAARIITPSEYLRRMVIGWGAGPERVVMVHNGIAEEEFSDYQASRRNAGELLRVAFIGRLTNWKGVDSLLLAAGGLNGINVTIIGDGPERPALTDLSTRLGITDSVIFLGRLSKERLAEELSKIHVLVLPSLYEGLSHTLLEAGAVGIPCIASNKGGNPEVIRDGVDGFLIDPWDVMVLKENLARFRDDEGLREKMGRAFQGRVRRDFPFNTTVEKTIGIILSV